MNVLSGFRLNMTCEFIGRLQKHFTKRMFLWSPNKVLNYEEKISIPHKQPKPYERLLNDKIVAAIISLNCFALLDNDDYR